jgi:hypothetical protein
VSSLIDAVVADVSLSGIKGVAKTGYVREEREERRIMAFKVVASEHF